MPNFPNIFESLIIKTMTGSANRIAEKAKSNAGWSSRIPEAISVSKVEKIDKGRYAITITVDSSEDGPAPHAAAFEYGSGEHSTKGEKGKYIIRPKEANALAFEWNPAYVPWGSKKFIGFTEDGRFLFNFVEHPGVEPKPYLRPAIEEEKKSIRGFFAGLMKKSYRDSVVRVEVISAKK